MVKRLKTLLRTYRRSSSLTQRELAYLLGLKDGAAISRVERSQRTPSIQIARACALVFGLRANELFPHLFAEVHEALRRRANDLYEELQGNPSKVTPFKLDFLEQLLARLDDQHPDVV